MTVGKIQASSVHPGRILIHSSGKIMSECCCAVKPAISLTPDLTFYGLECDTDTDSDNATVQNVGQAGSLLTWARTLAMDAALVGKLTAIPATGALIDGASETIAVSLAKSGITAGTHSATLTVAEQIVPGVAPATIDIEVEIDTYASFPATMNQHTVNYPPASFSNYGPAAKSQNVTFCIYYNQVVYRKRAEGFWMFYSNAGVAPAQGPIEMWYNPAYGFESKYIYSFVWLDVTRRVFIDEAVASPWTPPYPGTWNRGPEPTTVSL